MENPQTLPSRKGIRLFRDFRVPDPDKDNEARIQELKHRFIELISNEFLEADKPFDISDVLKPKLLFIFNWTMGIGINIRDNKGIQLFGEIGLGKSCILKATHNLISEIYECNSKYITSNNLARLFRNSDDESAIRINHLIFCQLLFIDDIGTEDRKVFDSFPIQEIIRERYDRRKITSYTTNLNRKELIDRYTYSIEDKLNHGTYRIEFKGISKR